MPPGGGTPCSINIIYTSLKVHLVGYNFVAHITGLFIRLAVVAFQNLGHDLDFSRSRDVIGHVSK